MSDEIKVTVIKYPDRVNLVLCYIDPVSGKRKTKSAESAVEKTAWKAAQHGKRSCGRVRYVPPSKVTWAAFRERYEAEHLASLKPKTRESACNALDAIERHLNPDRLCKINASALSTFRNEATEAPDDQEGRQASYPAPGQGNDRCQHPTPRQGSVVLGRCRGHVVRRSEDYHAKGQQGQEDERRGFGGGQFDGYLRRSLRFAPMIPPTGSGT